LSNFCPECGGELKLDAATKNFICKSCGLFASREKMDELRDKTFRDEGNDRKKIS
jgi:tRNA(Ile2) C34 agmatinyltransferase TiaS